MSKYHPIDVRHPANRQYRDPNYLLDPPGPDAGTPRPAAAPRRAASTPRRPARPAAAPWGGSPAPGDSPAPSPSRGWFRLLRLIIVLGVIGWIVSTETEVFEPLWHQLRLWSHELGLPF